MKKLLAVLLAAVMVIGCLAGCSGKEPEATEPETVPVQTETTVPVTEPEITEPEATEPEAPAVNHGKLVRSLYKLANPSGNYEDFESAIAWAVQAGVITDDAPFDPEAELTHLDMARYLYRYAKAQDIVRDSDRLDDLKGWVWDEAQITEEADREAVAWAIGSGVMQLYQRQFLPDEAVNAFDYRIIPSRISSLVKEVLAERKAAEEATEPEETEPEETEEIESGSESEGSGNSGSSGSGSGSSSGSGSGNSGSSNSGSGGSGSSSGNSGSGSSTTTEPTNPPEPPTYSKEEAMAAANNYLAGLGCTITTDVMWNSYSFPPFYDRASIAEYGGQTFLNQQALEYAQWFVAWRNQVDEDNGDVVDISTYRAYCYIMDGEDFCGPGYLIYIFYG